MLFYNLQMPEKLFRIVGKCEGAVSYVDGQGKLRDLKPVAAQMLSFGEPLRLRDIPALEVLAECPRDRERLVRLMMDSHC